MHRIVLIAVYSVMSLCSFSQNKMSTAKIIALYDKAIAYEKQKDYVNSHKCFQKLLPYLPEEAGFYLGEQYYYGLGVTENIEKALNYYQIAAEAGEPLSQQILATYYFKDEDTIRDHSLAFYWNKIASTNPDGVDCYDAGKCAYNLALCYLKGIGTNANEELGEIWMAMSAMLDFGKAQYYIVHKYNIPDESETKEEELLYEKRISNHLYNLVIPKIQNDTSIEALTIKCLYHLLNQSFSSFLNEAQHLYNNPAISNEGKKNIGDLLIAYYKNYKNDKYNAELIEEELSKLTNIDEVNYKYWFLQQFTICLSKIS